MTVSLFVLMGYLAQFQKYFLDIQVKYIFPCEYVGLVYA